MSVIFTTTVISDSVRAQNQRLVESDGSLPEVQLTEPSKGHLSKAFDSGVQSNVVQQKNDEKVDSTTIENDGKTIVIESQDGRLLRQTVTDEVTGKIIVTEYTTRKAGQKHLTATGISAPGAAISNKRFFMILNGMLHERLWQNGWKWFNHGAPPNKSLSSNYRPVGAEASSIKSVFVIDTNGELWERRLIGVQGAGIPCQYSWVSYGRPNGPILSNVSEIYNNGYRSLFMIADNPSSTPILWERILDNTINLTPWISHGEAYTALPFTKRGMKIQAPVVLKNHVFVVGANGKVYERWWNNNSWSWGGHGKANGNKVSRIGAAMDTNKFFAVTTNGRLSQRYWYNGWHWHDHGKISNNSSINIYGTPQVISDGKLHITSQSITSAGIIGRLKELYYNGSQWIWYDHGYPENPNFLTDPGAAMMNTKVFLAKKNNNQVFERHYYGGKWNWSDHGIPSGAAPTAFSCY